MVHAGKVLSKCGKCARYMKLISIRPMRLYCPTCEEVLNLPQVGVRMGLFALPAYSQPALPFTDVHHAITPCTLAGRPTACVCSVLLRGCCADNGLRCDSREGQ